MRAYPAGISSTYYQRERKEEEEEKYWELIWAWSFIFLLPSPRILFLLLPSSSFFASNERNNIWSLVIWKRTPSIYLRSSAYVSTHISGLASVFPWKCGAAPIEWSWKAQQALIHTFFRLFISCPPFSARRSLLETFVCLAFRRFCTSYNRSLKSKSKQFCLTFGPDYTGILRYQYKKIICTNHIFQHFFFFWGGAFSPFVLFKPVLFPDSTMRTNIGKCGFSSFFSPTFFLLPKQDLFMPFLLWMRYRLLENGRLTLHTVHKYVRTYVRTRRTYPMLDNSFCLTSAQTI